LPLHQITDAVFGTSFARVIFRVVVPFQIQKHFDRQIHVAGFFKHSGRVRETTLVPAKHHKTTAKQPKNNNHKTTTKNNHNNTSIPCLFVCVYIHHHRPNPVAVHTSTKNTTPNPHHHTHTHAKMCPKNTWSWLGNLSRESTLCTTLLISLAVCFNTFCKLTLPSAAFHLSLAERPRRAISI
jgi:hypothetical protein